MSYLELDGDRHKIPPGEAVIGSDASSFLVLSGADLAPQHAILVVTADGQVSVRRGSEEAAVFINGVQPPSPAPASSQPPAVASAPALPGPGRGILANLIVRKGQLKGHRFPIRVPIVNVGRAEYNDVVVPDASVSSAHAKVQLREGIWVVVDLDSTNGTYLDGDRVSGEAPIAPGAVIRFGEVSVVFESTKGDTAQKGGGTEVLGVIVPPEDQA